MRRNDAAVAEPAEDIEEVNMDDRLLGKLQSDVEYIKSDVVQIKTDMREMKRDIGGLQRDVGDLKTGLQQLDAKIDRTAAQFELSMEKMRGSNRAAFIAIIVLLVLTLMSSAPGAVATLLKLL